MNGANGMLDLLERVNLTHLPIGVYVVAEDGRFLACNAAARAIFGLAPEAPLCGSIIELHVDLDRHAELVRAAQKAEHSGDGFERAVVHLRVGSRDVYVEDCLRPLRTEMTGELLGYVGCMLDITDDHQASERNLALQEKIEELTLDIGRILHANTSTLLMVNQTLTAVAGALAPAELDANDSQANDPHALDAWIEQTAGLLAQALERLMTAGEPERRQQALPSQAWERLRAQVTLLRHYHDTIPIEEMRNPTLRTSAAAITSLCRRIPSHVLPREPLRDVLRLSRELHQSICFADVRTTRAAVIQMDFTLRALRDFITAEMRPREHRERLPVTLLVQEALAQLAEFARSSNVDILWRERPHDLYVFGSERDLLRALANLLHNAIKYSWRRDRGKPPWVSLRAEERDDMACIDFESWGVPITQDEIERGLIYQMGYRGKWSTDRGRLGTGIGLTDALRVATTHGGDLQVESQPAQVSGLRPEDDAYYRNPFLTRVTLRLPVSE